MSHREISSVYKQLNLENNESLKLLSKTPESNNDFVKEISASPFQVGDIILFNPDSDNPQNKFQYEITRSCWDNFHFTSDRPVPTITGHLVCHNNKFEDVIFNGSVFDKSILLPNQVTTRLNPSFLLSKQTEILMPQINSFYIFRKNNNTYPQVPTDEFDSINSKTIKHHQRHVLWINKLKDVISDNLRYKTKFSYDHRHFAVFNKDTNLWMGINHYPHEDFLQIAFCNLSGLDINKIFPDFNINNLDQINNTKKGIVTYNTSDQLGINVINYRLPNGIDIQIWPDNKIVIPYLTSPDKKPINNLSPLNEHKNSIKLSVKSNSSHTLTINKEVVDIYNPEYEINQIFIYLQDLSLKRTSFANSNNLPNHNNFTDHLNNMRKVYK